MQDGQPARDTSAPWRWLQWLWETMPETRVARCRRVRRGGLVEVHRSEDGAVWLAGVVTCGSVWLCPFCASSRSRAREAELKHAGRAWQSNLEHVEPELVALGRHPVHPFPAGAGWVGLAIADSGVGPVYLAGDPEDGEPWRLISRALAPGERFSELDPDERTALEWSVKEVAYFARPGLYLLTRTVRHGARQPLAWTVERMTAARNAWRSHRRVREALAMLGCAGTVRAGELTWGSVNGWHPHEHDLVFSTRVLPAYQRERVRLTLAEVWIECCRAQGLPEPTLEHGLDLRPTTVPEYLAKWGAAQEIALSRQKRGRGGMNPWQILDRASAGDKQCAALFFEYASVYPGQRWITWSKGLRARLLADYVKPECGGELVAVLMPPQWSRLVRAGAVAVGAYLASIAAGSPTARGPPDTS